MNITPENVLSAEHQSWLNHPVTIQLLRNLEKFKQSFHSANVVSSGSQDISDITFRVNAFGARTVESVIIQTRDTTKFIEQSEKK